MTDTPAAGTLAAFLQSNRIASIDLTTAPALSDILCEAGKNVAGLLREGRRCGKPMNLMCGFIDRVGFNAIAATFDDCDAILIFSDVPSLLLSVSRALVSHGLLFAGRVTPEVATSPVKLPGRLLELFGAARVWQVPPLADQEREAAAVALADLSFNFLLRHEFTHIYNGHTEYLARHRDMQALAEFNDPIVESPEGLERETLEFDADCAAMQGVLEIALEPELRNRDSRTVWTLPEQNRFGTRDDALELAYSAASLCGLFFAATETRDPIDPAPRKHPHATFRSMNNYLQTIQLLCSKTGLAQDTFDAVIIPAAKHFAESVLASMPTRPSDGLSNFEGLKAAHFARIDAWTATWARMHDELDVLKRGGTLAPASKGIRSGFSAAPAID